MGSALELDDNSRLDLQSIERRAVGDAAGGSISRRQVGIERLPAFVSAVQHVTNGRETLGKR